MQQKICCSGPWQSPSFNSFCLSLLKLFQPELATVRLTKGLGTGDSAWGYRVPLLQSHLLGS